MKGKKTCPNGHIVGARAAICNECDHTFYETRKAQKQIDWKELRPGQEFKSFEKNGPYYDGEVGRTYLGHYGNFKVVNLQKDGIMATDRKGFCFIYMGEVKPAAAGIMAPHKIELIRSSRNERD
jgi:hypothetical protein